MHLKKTEDNSFTVLKFSSLLWEYVGYIQMSSNWKNADIVFSRE